MSVPAAYIVVILIWSTTPLGIQWSGVEVGYEFGVALRMIIGLFALLVIARLWKLAVPWDNTARRVYLSSGLSLFLAMSFVYWAAQYIPSGWIAVIFGLSPVLTSVFATLILRENAFTPGRILGMTMGLCGLAVVFVEGLNISTAALSGVAAVTFSAVSQSLGAVVIRKLKPRMHAISITIGSLIVSIPLFIANAFYSSDWPTAWPMQSVMAIVYLAVFGTAMGFPLYYYLLKNVRVERVALITLITPITALLLGAAINDEVIGSQVWLGTALILGGLAIYEYGKYLPFKKKWQIRWNQRPL
ncbi:MAG: EamA family transporter [Gammaproteobacteria bacterium]|nr:EamA family transporter [Gammaproteobacteria bacterium]